jgi:hypothetical protein
MYDRDYVKQLEREMELSGGNRFEKWNLSSEKPEVAELNRPVQPSTDETPATRAAAARAS